MKEYIIPFKNAEETLIEKKSKFIGRIIKVETEEQAKKHLDDIRKSEKGAVHNCFAYIIKDQNIERFSDDGEPQGTAGKPILEVVKKENITNVLCVVTRYFGGTLLGTGGLVRAYNQTAKKALETAGIALMLPFKVVKIQCSYNIFDILQKSFENYTLYIGETEYGENIVINLSILESEYDDFALKIKELTSATVMPKIIGTEYKGKQIELK